MGPLPRRAAALTLVTTAVFASRVQALVFAPSAGGEGGVLERRAWTAERAPAFPAAGSLLRAHRDLAFGAVGGGLGFARILASDLGAFARFLRQTLTFSTRFEDNPFFVLHREAAVVADRLERYPELAQEEEARAAAASLPALRTRPAAPGFFRRLWTPAPCHGASCAAERFETAWTRVGGIRFRVRWLEVEGLALADRRGLRLLAPGLDRLEAALPPHLWTTYPLYHAGDRVRFELEIENEGSEVLEYLSATLLEDEALEDGTPGRALTVRPAPVQLEAPLLPRRTAVLAGELPLSRDGASLRAVRVALAAGGSEARSGLADVAGAALLVAIAGR